MGRRSLGTRYTDNEGTVKSGWGPRWPRCARRSSLAPSQSAMSINLLNARPSALRAASALDMPSTKASCR